MLVVKHGIFFHWNIIQAENWYDHEADSKQSSV